MQKCHFLSFFDILRLSHSQDHISGTAGPIKPIFCKTLMIINAQIVSKFQIDRTYRLAGIEERNFWVGCTLRDVQPKRLDRLSPYFNQFYSSSIPNFLDICGVDWMFRLAWIVGTNFCVQSTRPMYTQGHPAQTAGPIVPKLSWNLELDYVLIV